MGRRRSARAIGALRPTNKAGQSAAEPAEPRAGTEGNASQQSAFRARNRVDASQALDRIRQAARRNKKEKFTALLHHLSVERLEEAFFDGQTSWPATGSRRRASFTPGQTSASPSNTQGRSRMREFRPYGSVRGACSSGRPYRDRSFWRENRRRSPLRSHGRSVAQPTMPAIKLKELKPLHYDRIAPPRPPAP